ncbi:MAG: cytochrome c biogenesis heme-transporting ATPase CcmA [Gammaproteobacteria bacterium]|nr:cytochrome c biogenesis heme-transporting ATPase CcmA [Gammaproteobacteria bacterium]
MSGKPGISLEVRNLECVRDDRILFSALNFSICPGEVIQIEGHNGCGKTSLLRILCGLALPMEGEVLWCGQSIDEVRYEFLSQLSYLGHHNGVKGELSPLENLAFTRAISIPLEKDHTMEILAQLALRGFEDVPCRTLSAGQNRRVGLARLLVTKSRLWVLDEPFTALDRRGMRVVEHIFGEHVSAGGMIVTTTHHPLNIGNAKVLHLNLSELSGDL